MTSEWAKRQLDKPPSWTIVRLADNAVMLETSSQLLVSKLNTGKYKSVPILEHLVGINKRLKVESIG